MKRFSTLLLVATMGLVMACRQMTLDEAVEAANRNCPMQIDDATVITKIEHQGDYVVYWADVDEGADGDVNMLNDSILNAEVKRNILVYIQKGMLDGDTRRFIGLCKDSKVGIEYRYIGSRTNNQALVRIEHTEL